ncbi:SMR family transporter [Comamonas jiangduensis]|uniref:SMR family transporter n=1 Tax=Comamonas jiangduensis TaxID=1194168 RepID=UPI003BF8874B
MSAEGLPTLGSGYGYLGIAIVAEVLATSFLKSAEGFTRLWPSVIVAAGYGIAFLCLSLTLRTIPTGVAYAIWSGAGIVLVSAIAWIFLGQKLDTPALIGMGLILAGVLVINLFSKTAGH